LRLRERAEHERDGRESFGHVLTILAGDRRKTPFLIDAGSD
jgi:hypothetical protein